MNPYNILIVEDEVDIARAIEAYLNNQGYKTFMAGNGIEGLEVLSKEEIHLAIVDVMMPKMDGITFVMKLREKYDFPVIMLSAKSEDIDKINGLNTGADDYITKPFNPLELIARVNSQIRRYTHLGSIADKQQEGNTYWSGDLVINDDTKQVTVEGKNVKLTPTEYNILKFLTKNKGIVYSIEQIYQNVWEDECYGAENIIAVHIRHIREKIEINPREPKYLKVIWGIGYKIENLEK